MKKFLPFFLLSLMTVTCTKNDTQSDNSDNKINLLEVVGRYNGFSNLYSEGNCNKTCGMYFKVIITDLNQVEISDAETGAQHCGLFVFPLIKAQLIKKYKGIYYFNILPDQTPDYKIWGAEKKNTAGFNYNIALYTNGSMEGRLNYHDIYYNKDDLILNFEGAKK